MMNVKKMEKKEILAMLDKLSSISLKELDCVSRPQPDVVRIDLSSGESIVVPLVVWDYFYGNVCDMIESDLEEDDDDDLDNPEEDGELVDNRDENDDGSGDWPDSIECHVEMIGVVAVRLYKYVFA